MFELKKLSVFLDERTLSKWANRGDRLFDGSAVPLFSQNAPKEHYEHITPHNYWYSENKQRTASNRFNFDPRVHGTNDKGIQARCTFIGFLCTIIVQARCTMTNFDQFFTAVITNTVYLVIRYYD